jgi:uncharacterized protein VirK/YbjX
MLPHFHSALSTSGAHLTAVSLSALTWHLLQLARATHPGLAPRSLWRAFRLFVVEMRWLGLMRPWYSDTSNPALVQMLRMRPDLVCAADRPYVNSGWTARQRLDAIQCHYRQVQGPRQFLGFAPGEQARLGTLALAGGALDIVLDKPPWFVHEGEVTLSLFRGELRLYSLVFLLGEHDGRRVAYIGALQGMGSAQALDALDIYRDLTHALHGLRPRDLLITAFRMLCARAGITHILAISDAHSMGRSPYFAREQLQTSYDSAWLEHQGVPAAEGFFELPTVAPRRRHEEIPSRKRAQYRRRYEMLDLLDAQIGSAVSAA